MNGVDTLAHQRLSGANYYDTFLKTMRGGISATATMAKGKIAFLSSISTSQFLFCKRLKVFFVYTGLLFGNSKTPQIFDIKIFCVYTYFDDHYIQSSDFTLE